MQDRFPVIALVILICILAVLIPVKALDIRRNSRAADFHQVSVGASGAVFLDQYDGGNRRFYCSGTVIGHTTKGDALFLTAKHCVWQQAVDHEGLFFSDVHPARLAGPEEVTFAANSGGPYYKAIPFKISRTDDIALLLLKNGAGLPEVRLGDETLNQADDRLTNYSYGLDYGKFPVSLKFIEPSLAHVPPSILEDYPEWTYAMPVSGSVAPGASGSGVFDPTRRTLIGVAVGITEFGNLSIVVPVSRVWRLLSDPHPLDYWNYVAPPAPTHLTATVK